MTYTATQIENAKRAYLSFLQYTTTAAQQPEIVGTSQAEQRAEYHNSIVSKINAGDAELAKEWKLFFLKEQVKADEKEFERKEKLSSNKAASADILAPMKAAKKLVAFGEWLNTSGNKFRKEHFSKKYTAESVAAFLLTL
jgi:hypothetical protein